ncbi:MAG: DnaJ domain-containing protein, partial [Chryseobacterium sp.]
MKDYYKILEVEEQSSEDDIKKSYRTLSKKYHPDVNP